LGDPYMASIRMDFTSQIIAEARLKCLPVFYGYGGLDGFMLVFQIRLPACSGYGWRFGATYG
jgi:hypothetical protein